MTTVKLTLAQVEQVEWALSPMPDYWCTEHGAHERDGEVLPDTAIPTIAPHKQTSRLLVLSAYREVNEDLLYRLEDQLPDMARQASGFDGNRGGIKAARNAALRIRQAMKYHSHE